MKKISILTITLAASLLAILFIDLYSLSKKQPAASTAVKSKPLVTNLANNR